jgi:hypothetical protein
MEKLIKKKLGLSIVWIIYSFATLLFVFLDNISNQLIRIWIRLIVILPLMIIVGDKIVKWGNKEN